MRGADEMSDGNMIAQYDIAEGHVEIHDIRGGFSVFVGERKVQQDLGASEIVRYLCHVLQAVNHRLVKRAALERDHTKMKAYLEATQADKFKTFGDATYAAELVLDSLECK